MTREDVIAIAGSLEDRFIVEILDAGGDRADLIEAVARARCEPLDFPAAARPMSATASRLCEILQTADTAVAAPLALNDGRPCAQPDRTCLRREAGWPCLPRQAWPRVWPAAWMGPM